MNLIHDRTESDVQNGTEKGCYNASDLNRVGAAVQSLAEQLSENGYSVSISPKLDWAVSDIPSVPQMEAYLGDVRRIRDALSCPRELPASMTYLTHIGANQIELALEQTETYLLRMIAATVAQCGITYCGVRL